MDRRLSAYNRKFEAHIEFGSDIMKNITNQEFEQLRVYIYKNYGINLTEKKKTLVMSRLNKVLLEKGFDSYGEYFDYVMNDTSGRAVTELINRITTNHTFFFREVKHFEFFTAVILPQLERDNQRSKDLRIWSAGCSTGDEPYTLSMLMMDYFDKDYSKWDVKVLGTDISRQVLDHARSGLYELEATKEMPDPWVKKYFFPPQSEMIKIRDEIKSNVVFRRFNLMNPFPFKKPFHVIFCRNVMIYFDQKTKLKLTKKFYDALEPGGYLLVGHSESIDLENTGFKYIRPAIYRKG